MSSYLKILVLSSSLSYADPDLVPFTLIKQPLIESSLLIRKCASPSRGHGLRIYTAGVNYGILIDHYRILTPPLFFPSLPFFHQ